MSRATSAWPVGYEWVPIALAILGGAYLGLFSCGGYSWHRQAIWAVLIVSATTAALMPPSRSVGRRVLLLLACGVTFIVVQAAVAPFHPAVPESVSDYFKGFAHALEHGPC